VPLEYLQAVLLSANFTQKLEMVLMNVLAESADPISTSSHITTNNSALSDID
jgi:hypothetical protein